MQQEGTDFLENKKSLGVTTAEALLIISTFVLFLYIYDNYTYFGFLEDLYRFVFPTVLLYLMPLTTFCLFLQSYIYRLKGYRNLKTTRNVD